MSYTIVQDQQETAKQIENVVNRLHRHCRIGKVRRKMQILGGKWVLPPDHLPERSVPQPQPPFTWVKPRPPSKGWL